MFTRVKVHRTIRRSHQWKEIFCKKLIEKSNGFMFIQHRWCKLSSTPSSHREFLNFIVITSPHSIRKVSPRCCSHDKCLLEASLLSRYVRVKEFLIEESFWNLHWRVLPRYKEKFLLELRCSLRVGKYFQKIFVSSDREDSFSQIEGQNVKNEEAKEITTRNASCRSLRPIWLILLSWKVLKSKLFSECKCLAKKAID